MTNEQSERETSLVTAKTPLKGFPVASLFFTHGERAGQEIPLTRDTFFIGRSKNNNLVLMDKSVSRKHVVINLLEGAFVLSDLNSLKGTYVNGKKIEEVILNPGDVINIGENRMQFRLLSSTGGWVVSRKRNGIWFFLAALIIGAVIGVSSWLLVQKYYSDKMPKEIATRIEMHYNKGVELFNKTRDVEGARKEWEEVLKLDPGLKTDIAIKASKLLKSTGPENVSK